MVAATENDKNGGGKLLKRKNAKNHANNANSATSASTAKRALDKIGIELRGFTEIVPTEALCTY